LLHDPLAQRLARYANAPPNPNRGEVSRSKHLEGLGSTDAKESRNLAAINQPGLIFQ